MASMADASPPVGDGTARNMGIVAALVVAFIVLTGCASAPRGVAVYDGSRSSDRSSDDAVASGDTRPKQDPSPGDAPPASDPGEDRNPGPGDRPVRQQDGLVGRYFTGMGTFNLMGSDGNYYGVAFVDDSWAYWGMPEQAWPSCPATSGGINPAQPGDGWGCVRYRWDQDSGKLEIDGQQGTFQDGELRIADLTFTPMYLPEAGESFEFVLSNKGYSGMCGPVGGCTTWSTTLALTDSGTFLKSEQSLSSLTGGGADTYAGSFPADEHGTYEILPDSQLRLIYADGTTELQMFSVRTDSGGEPDPADVTGDGGVVLGKYQFWASS